MGILKRKISNAHVLWLIEEIIRSNPSGIPIGNLTSQLFANVYLNELDHYVKRVLKEKYYIRYMDDFLILGTDKKKLAEDREKIKVFLQEKLKLVLHPKKSEIFPIDPSTFLDYARNKALGAGKGIDFLGYVLKDGKRYLRKDTVKRFIKKKKKYSADLRSGKISAEDMKRVDTSWRGYAKFADSYMLMKKLKF
jgi:hypothetical protein